MDQMADMESTMLEIEEMLREIEDVSSIIEFNATSSAQGAAQDRGLFRAAGGGAAVLAQAVTEDLKKWHERNEMHVVEYGSEHAERLRRSVHSQKAEQESREFVRTLVRERLFDIAGQTLANSVEEVNSRKKIAFKDKGVEAGSSIEAFSNLQNRLQAAVNPLFSIQGEPPQEMLAASRAARWAVERKKQRSVGRRHRLPELENHLDASLLDEAETYMSQRKSDLYNQCELQMEALKQLQEAQHERIVTNDLFDELVKTGTTSSIDPWKSIRPAGLAQDTPVAAAMANIEPTPPPRVDAQGNPVMPQLGTAVEDAITATLAPQLMAQGGLRIRDLRTDFYQSYLAKDSGERARMVGSELERWQLKTKIELLKDLIAMSQSTHAGIMEQLRSSLEFRDDDPTDQLHRTLGAAEAFQVQRGEFFDGQVDSAETAIQSFCTQSIEQLLSIRRRTELASLKRWNDVGAGLNASLDVSWVSCQTQLVRELKTALGECHKIVKIPVANLEIERGRKNVEQITVAWKRCGTHVPQQLIFLETLTKAIPATVESCAVTKAALALLEEELESIIKRLQEPPAALQAGV